MLQYNAVVKEFLDHPAAAKSGLMLCLFFVILYRKNIFDDPRRLIIAISTRPIFSKFARMVDRWQHMNDLNLVLRFLKGRYNDNQFVRLVHRTEL